MSVWIFRLMGFFTFFSLPLFAQEAPPPPPPRDQGFTQTLVMLTIAVLFFYFILWRPEQKRRKELEDRRSRLEKGDKVTAMGILGTVVKVQEHTVILKLYDGAKMEVLRAAITDVESAGAEETSSESKRVPLNTD